MRTWLYLAEALAAVLGCRRVLLGTMPADRAASGAGSMPALRLVLGDQLSRSLSALRDLDHSGDVVLMMEVRDESTYVRHHPQKIVLILSAMRHLAAELQAGGVRVDYVRLDDPGNTGSFTGEVRRALARHAVDRIVATEPGEWRVREMMQDWSRSFGLAVEIRDDDRFLCSRAGFAAWAGERRSLRMEYFYRDMRRKTGWLMAGDQPMGGRWNYDTENRKPLPDQLSIPPRRGFLPDLVTQEVMALVGQEFAGHFGDLASFAWAVTREDALSALRHFIDFRLAGFGDYQDAMRSGEDWLFHSALSPYLNIGLLTPHEVCEAALTAYRQNSAPLAAVEGLVRQILGWREYVRGIYWLRMPDYARSNYLGATRPLPGFYWTGETALRCVGETVAATRRNAYAHHIQRLMVTGNFALLTGIAPAEVEAWYLSVYADAFEWVELPNTHGMVLHADGGLLGSKPYAASGAYIHRMSDYCKGCAYDPKAKLGPRACPFNYLYWHFLIANAARLKGNPRLAMPYRTLAGMAEAQRRAIVEEAGRFIEGMG